MAEDPKDPKDPGNTGNPNGTPPGNPDPNVVALQQKLSQKDIELKEAQSKLDDALKNAKSNNAESNQEVVALTQTVKELTEKLTAVTTEMELKKISEKYPDILPELLLGKSEAERDLLVKKQQELNQARIGKMPSLHTPEYHDVVEVDKAIEDLKKDTSLTTEQKMQKLRELKNIRNEF